MGLPFGPTIVNVFWTFYEVNWHEQCPKEFKLVFIEDILMTFLFYSSWMGISQNFVIILVLVMPSNISFSFEQENKWKVVI